MPYIFTSFCSVKLHENSTHSPFLSGLKLFPSTAVLSWEPTMYNDMRLKKRSMIKEAVFLSIYDFSQTLWNGHF